MIRTAKTLIHIITQLFHLWKMSKREPAFAPYGEAVEIFLESALKQATQLRHIGARMFEDGSVAVPRELTCNPPCTVPDIGDAP